MLYTKIKQKNRFIFILFSFQYQPQFQQFKLKKIIDVVGIRTRGYRMLGADQTTELWLPLKSTLSKCTVELIQKVY